MHTASALGMQVLYGHIILIGKVQLANPTAAPSPAHMQTTNDELQYNKLFPVLTWPHKRFRLSCNLTSVSSISLFFVVLCRYK
jgi:hypothetical protein